MLRDKNILIISPEPWEHIFVSKHHYAINLAKRGNRVFFLNPPTKENTKNETEFSGVWSVNYSGFIKGIRLYPRFLQRFLMKRKINLLQRLCGTRFDIVWSFDNSVFFYLDIMPPGVLRICHTVDLNQNFNLSSAAKSADICFCTSEAIQKRLLLYNSVTYKIAHGFNKTINFKNIQLPGKNHVKCFYAGNLDIPYLDWDLVHAIVKKYPQIDFIFAGQWKYPKGEKPISMYSNFFYIGIAKAEDLQSYYKSSDILLICYLDKIFTDQLSNPHKMMEYLGSGTMVVATWTEEYALLVERELILMSKGRVEFLNNFEDAFTHLDKWNDIKKREMRKAIAYANTYQKQIDRIENLIYKQ